ncbi:hypothetical protein BKA63DRAFT_428179 [Paraphoma chrysanthemicola]|nr:hypothetical protein BKA63DRAFT_428179 [Paraphoma chrysanthemicola]
MHCLIVVCSALCGLTAAVPQKINIQAALAVPTPRVGLGPNAAEAIINGAAYDQATAIDSVLQRVKSGGVAREATQTKRAAIDDCALQPGGAGPVPGDGSVNAYLNINNNLRKAARDASTPAGYRREFSDEQAATQQIGYLTYKNLDDGKYNVQKCADFCNSEEFCIGFNIYFERDPKIKPAPVCSNPQPITNVKCSIYGYPVSQGTATNKGQYREKFRVVIVGSNGYSKLNPVCKDAPTIASFDAPTNLDAAINAPLIKKNGKDYDTYNGMVLFNDFPFDPALCAAACQAQTEYDKKNLVDSNGEYKPCNFFTSYVLTKNGVPLGTYCALYTQSWDKSYAVNTGYTSGSDVYEVICAASYSATFVDPGKVGGA